MTWACPKCDSKDLRIEIVGIAILDQDDAGNFELEVVSDTEWNDESLMLCAACDYSATASMFVTEETT